MANWQANINPDDLPWQSAANQIGPDEDIDKMRANPDFMAKLRSPGYSGKSGPTEPPPTPPNVPIASAPPTPPPTAEPEKPLADLARQGITGELRTGKSEESMAEQLGTVDPAIQTAQQARDAAADKAASFNDAPYQPSLGEKFKRGLSGGLKGMATGKGFIRGAIDPGAVGATPYGAPNAEGQEVQQKLLGEQKTTARSYDEALDNWKRVNEARKEGLSATKDAATAYGGAAGHATGEQNAENKPDTEENKTAAKLALDQKTFEARKQRLQTDPTLTRLSPLQKAYYLAKGELYQPRETSEGDVLASNIAKGMAAFQAKNGRGPKDLEEFNSVISAAKGDLGKGKGAGGATPQQLSSLEARKKVSIDKALKDFADEPKDKEEALQAIENGYEAELARLQPDSVIPHVTVSVDEKGQTNWSAPTISSAPAAPPPVTMGQRRGGSTGVMPAAPGEQTEVPPGGPIAPPAPTPKTKPEAATHTVKSKADGKLHWTNNKGTVDYGVAE